MSDLSAANQAIRDALDRDIRNYAEMYNGWMYRGGKDYACPYPLQTEAHMLDRIAGFVDVFRDENDRKDNAGHFVIMTMNYLRRPFRKHALAIVHRLVSDADSLHDIDKIRYLRFLQKPDKKSDKEPGKLLSTLNDLNPKLLKSFVTFNVLKNEAMTKEILSDFKSCIEMHSRDCKDVKMVKDLVNTLVDSNDGFNREQILQLSKLYFLTTEMSKVSPNNVMEEPNFLEKAMAHDISGDKNETLKGIVSSYCEHLAASKKVDGYLYTEMKKMLENGIRFGNMNVPSKEELKAVFEKLPENKSAYSRDLTRFTEETWKKYIPTIRNVISTAKNVFVEEECYYDCSRTDIERDVLRLEQLIKDSSEMYGKELSLFDANEQNGKIINKSLVNKVAATFAKAFEINKGNIDRDVMTAVGAMFGRFVRDYNYNIHQVKALALNLCPIKNDKGEKFCDKIEKNWEKLKGMKALVMGVYRDKMSKAGERALTPAMVLSSKGGVHVH